MKGQIWNRAPCVCCIERLPEQSNQRSGNCEHLIKLFCVRGKIKTRFDKTKIYVHCAQRLPEHLEQCSGNCQHLIFCSVFREKRKAKFETEDLCLQCSETAWTQLTVFRDLWAFDKVVPPSGKKNTVWSFAAHLRSVCDLFASCSWPVCGLLAACSQPVCHLFIASS